MFLGRVFSKETIVVPVESTEKDELFEELVEKLHAICPEFDKAEAINALLELERALSTGIMHSGAIPHALINGVKSSIGAIGISRDGIDWDSLDKKPVHVVFLMIGAENETESHIQILKSLALVLQIPEIVDKMVACDSATSLHSLLCSAEESLS